MPNSVQMPTRAPALILLAGMIVGLCIAQGTPAPLIPALSASAVLAILSIRQAPHRPTLWAMCFTAAAILAFWSYGTLRLPTPPDSKQLQLPEREAVIVLEIERILQSESRYGTASGLARVVRAQPDRWPGDSRVYFHLELPEDDRFTLQRGAQLEGIGVMTPIPANIDPDSFEGYLKSIGIHYSFERIHQVKELHPASPFEQFCQRMNTRLEGYLRLGAPADRNLENIYIAMLLGQKAELSGPQKDRFQITGTMHFFAISGLHIGVIATVIAQFLILIRVPRRLSPFIGLPLLYLYVEITGASPSAVRAFLMALFFWASFAFSRQRSPLAALAASAVFVLIFRPDQLWSIGFQLSYTVVLSILLFGLPLYEAASQRLRPFRYLPDNSWKRSQRAYAWLQDALLLLFSISFAAWLASAPLSAGFFGFISPGAILLNMLLVNLAALTISTGMISLSMALMGMEGLSSLLNHSAWVSIHAMNLLVQASTRIPGAMIPSDHFPKGLSYAALFVYFGLLFALNRRRPTRLVYWLLPPAVILGSLTLGTLLG